MTHDCSFAPCCATIGFFDGVHRGHQYLLSQLRADANDHAMQSLVVTFRQHPRQVLQQDYVPRLLTTPERKEQLLLATGVDRVAMLDFSLQLSALSAEEFMSFLRTKYNVRRLLTGYDNRFGHNREETFEDYRRYGEALGIVVEAAKAFADGGVSVSSSMVRRLLAEGNIHAANACLGYRFGFSGTVEHGFGEGHKLGFPTANLRLADSQFVPRSGVYAVMVSVEGVQGDLMGMMNIGSRPTFGTFNDTVEVNIFGFDRDIYGSRVDVTVVERIRDDRKFDTIEQLRRQLERDRVSATILLKK
jgi:riboflavin kinase / FMN adenylyltransferase